MSKISELETIISDEAQIQFRDDWNAFVNEMQTHPIAQLLEVEIEGTMFRVFGSPSTVTNQIIFPHEFNIGKFKTPTLGNFETVENITTQRIMDVLTKKLLDTVKAGSKSNSNAKGYCSPGEAQPEIRIHLLSDFLEYFSTPDRSAGLDDQCRQFLYANYELDTTLAEIANNFMAWDPKAKLLSFFLSAITRYNIEHNTMFEIH